jgi:4-aminobutyrate aminotransferase-like enzyme
MWGIEVESSELCKSIVGSSLKQGIIILGGGMKGNVVQFTPPLTISGEEIAIFGKRFTQALQDLDEWEKA